MPPTTDMVTFIVTEQRVSDGPRLWTALRKAIPDALIHATGFRDVTRLDAADEAGDIAQRITSACADCVGHLTLLVTETESTVDAIQQGAIAVSTKHVGRDDSFRFRLQKRGSHWLEPPTPELERTIGGAIWDALQNKYDEEPEVDLNHPDVTVRAEVLGPITGIGITRKAWLIDASPDVSE